VSGTFFGTTDSSYDNLDRLSGVIFVDTLVDGFAMDDLGNQFLFDAIDTMNTIDTRWS